MKTVLCFGDSNTWGYDPASGARQARDVRWTGVLRQDLGGDYLVIEEGLNGRTTLWDDPISPGKNGRTYLTPCLETHAPLDMIVIMLGTNDLRRRFNLEAADIAEAAGELAYVARRSACGPDGSAPVVLLLAPPVVVELTQFAGMFAGAREKSREFSHYFTLAASWNDCAFLDTAEIIVSSPLDGIHFEAAEHHKLGRAVADAVRRLLPEPA
jgi:lysophospholipase L1-like esterase